MLGNLKFGLTSIHSGNNSNPENMLRAVLAAENAGFDSVWAGGHPFLSEKQSRIPPTLSLLDPIVALSYVAARTRTVRLGTGILLLPQFNPLILAKQLASLDVVSSGRLIFGVGVGWSEHEYEVLGLDYHNRGERADEYLEAMKVVWRDDKPVFHGRFVSFDSLQSLPHPVQKPHPPIVIGGNSPGAARRAIEKGNGWFGYGLNLEQIESAIAKLHEAEKRYTRPKELGELEISVAPSIPIDKPTAQKFAELGVHRLILIPPPNLNTPALEQFIENVGKTLVGKV
jgi:probable F420-dependent oxidoreductase